ncbi:MAG: type IV pili methyl-accepting chemotaxis transducer N-terminal domain-containing protein, partial [Wenzhouxiangella sp.]
MSSVVTQTTEQRLSPAQLLLFALLVALMGLVAYNFYLLNQRNIQETQYLALTTDIQVRAQQLAKAAGESAVGNFDAFDELRETRNIIDSAVHTLRNGREGLPPSPPQVEDSLVTLEDNWGRIDVFANQILDRTDLVIELAESASAFSTNIPQLQAQSDEVVRRMIETGAPTVQIYVASRQLVLADRMLRRVGDIMAGGTGAITAADAFSRDAGLFERVLQGLINGDEGLNLVAVRNSQVLEALADVMPLFEEIRIDVDTILTASTDLFEVREAADEIFLSAEDLTNQARRLAGEYATIGDNEIWPSLLAGLALAGGTLLILFLIGMGAYMAQRKRARATTEINQRNQDAILRLLDEMSSLADGDLT